MFIVNDNIFSHLAGPYKKFGMDLKTCQECKIDLFHPLPQFYSFYVVFLHFLHFYAFHEYANAIIFI